jgi:WD40 repeat protein
MKLQTRSYPGALDKNHKAALLLLRCLACLSLCVAIDLVSTPAQSTVANQAAPAISRPELVLQTGHEQGVLSLAFSPDRLLLASGSSDNTVKLWDTTTKRELRTIAGHKGPVNAVAFSGDGKWLASGGVGGDIKFHDVVSGRELLNLKGSGSVNSVAFSPDGRWFASGNEKTINLWDLKGWDLTTNREPRTLPGHSRPVQIVRFSADNQWLASGSWDHTVKIWDVVTGREVDTLKGHTDRITSLAFSADGQWLATSGFDARIKLWKVGVWSEQPLQMGAANEVLAVAFDLESRKLVSVDRKKQIKLHDVQTGRALSIIDSVVKEDEFEAVAIAFSSDVRWLVTSTGDKTIELRDVDTGRDVHSLKTYSHGVNATAFSSGGHWFATGGRENTVRLWEVATGRELRTLEFPNSGYVNSVAFSPDEKWLASGDGSGHMTVWEVANSQLVRCQGAHQKNSSVNAVAFSPDGKWIASGGGDHTVRVWSVANCNEVRRASMHSAEVNAVAISPDGNWIASGSADETIKIWESATGRELRTLPGHKGQVLAVSFSPDGRSVASGGLDGTVRIWNADTGVLAQTLKDHEGEVKTVAFTKDGRLASGSKDNRIDLWDVVTGRVVKKLVGHTSEVYALAFSPDDNWLASGSEDGSTRLWDAKTGDVAATLISLRESAESPETNWLVVSPDGLFDGSPAAWNQILWRFNQSTSDVLPVEVFFNEFFSPGLLGEILAKNKPLAPKNISRRDRRQPSVKLMPADAKVSDGGSVATRDLTVRIRVEEAPPDKDHATGSGARDVRLFRNGSLVKIWRGERGGTTLETTIKIVAGPNQLTAYAFNRDDIKSADSALTLNGAESLKRPATAFILAVGINKYDNADYNLKYAVPDANAFSEVVGREQNVLGRFNRIEIIPLLDSQATKANILYVLHRLAGIEGPARPAPPPQLPQLKAAEPEDTVVIYFAGHGEAYKKRFYMLPHDLGYAGPKRDPSNEDLENIRAHSISDKDLEVAFEEVNAGQILFVLDACHSGQALEAEEKRRGPMNSKGLAQLAYEKGMYVLAAAQGDQAAWEAHALLHGLLTYALIEEGLKQGRADRAPNDEHILLQEWLDYAIERVPQLQEEQMQARDSSKNPLAFVEGEKDVELSKRSLQRPRAFYRPDLPFLLIANSPPVSNIITPNLEDFPNAGLDYQASRSLEEVKTHMKDFLNAQYIRYREEKTDYGVVITVFVDLPGRGRRSVRAAFLIKIVPMKQAGNCTLTFTWLVQSKGNRENTWTIQPEDTKDYARGFVEPIDMELKKLAGSPKPKS